MVSSPLGKQKLRILAMLYVVEDVLREIAGKARVIEAAQNIRIPSPCEAVIDLEPLQHVYCFEAGEITGMSAAQIANLANKMRSIGHLVEVAKPSLKYFAEQLREPYISAKSIPERGFTGYCNNRNRYGPRTPKKR